MSGQSERPTSPGHHRQQQTPQRLSRLGALGAISSLCLGCFGTPSALAPQLKGSIGVPHSGVQTDAVELPRSGAGFTRFRPFGSAYWGQPELVAAIQNVAQQTQHRFGGPPLVLGDLSARHGGKIPRHNSHRSGRDVDLLWHLLTENGEPYSAVGFVRVGPDGLAVDPASGKVFRLHVERQWETVKAFLLSEQIDVQWMFCSRWIEALLIDYALAKGEPHELVFRAETVMLQPADSLPHDDHIHLRISCTPETSLTGCEGGGPYWGWLSPLPALQLSAADLQEIGQSDPLVVEADDEVATRE